MWELIKIMIGIAIALMAFSMLLGSLLLPLVIIANPQPAYAQENQQPVNPKVLFSQIIEEDIVTPQEPQQSSGYRMPASEKLVVPTDDKTFERIATQDLLAEMSVTEQEDLGVLTVEQSGFKQDLWAGVSRERVEILLKRIREQGLVSATARDLMKRLLLARAKAPDGPANQHWLATRVQTLQAMGYVDDAHKLLNQLPTPPNGVGVLAQVWVNDQLLIGQTQAACGYVSENLMNTDAPFWQQAIMVCQALKGNLDELRLSYRTLDERDKTSDSLVFALFDAIMNSGESPRLAPEDVFNPLHVALYQAYPHLINPEVMQRLPDVSLRRILKTSELDMSLRLQAAEKLVNDFAAPEDAGHLTSLYNEVEFTQEMVASPLKFVRQEVDGSRARALLWQGANSADLPSGKALALKTLWERAEEDRLLELPGHLTPNLIGIQPERNLAWFSPYVIKMSLIQGNLSTAKSWWEVLSNNRSLSRDLSVEKTDIAMAFAMLDGQLQEGVLDQWWSTQTLHNLEARLKTTRVLAILEALNMHVPSDLWVSIHHEFNDAHVDTPPGPGPIWLRLVGRSLEEGHAAEAILMLIEPLMYNHATKLPPQGMANVVAGFNYLGLLADAKAFALESVIKGEKTSN